MAIIKKGILGGFSNKIGNVVGSTWKGIDVMRALPQNVANPNTEKQQRQRSKFKDASHLASGVLHTIVKPFWDRKAVRMSGYNLLVKTQLEKVKDKDMIEPEDIIFTEGCTYDARMSIPAQDESEFDIVLWSETECSTSGVADKVYIVLVDLPTNGVVAVLSKDFEESVEFRVTCVPMSRRDQIGYYAFIGNEKTGLSSKTVIPKLIG